MSSPILWGPGGIANNLENAILNANGSVLSSSGAKNYIANSTFANGATTGYSLFNTTLTGGLPTGTISAGAASLTLGLTSTTPLEGANNLQVVAAGAVTAGHGVITDVFTIDRDDQAKMLTFKYLFEFISGAANVNLSGVLGSQSFVAYIYDVTNSAWVQPTGFLSMSSLGAGLASGGFQSNALGSGNQYRLAVVCVQATAGAMTLNLTGFGVSPQTPVAQGALITDWVDYTPTVSNIPGTVTKSKWRRVGDSMEIYLKYAVTGAATGTITTTIPSQYSIDTNKFDGGVDNNLGSIHASTTAAYIGIIQLNTASPTTFRFASSGGTSVWNATTPSAWANGSDFTLQATIPIVGWSSGVSIGGADDARVVAASYSVSGSSAIANSVTTTIPLTNKIIDTHGAVSGNQFLVPSAGIYRISVVGGSDASVNTGAVTLYGRKSGSNIGNPAVGQSSTAGLTYPSGIWYASCIAGDLLDVQMNYSQGANKTISAVVHFDKLSGSAQIAATESVSCSYAGTSSAVTSAYGTLIYNTKVWDSHSSYSPSSGVFTAVTSGKFHFSGSALFGGTIAANQYFNIAIALNGTTYREGGGRSGGAVTDMIAIIGITIPMNAGDTVVFQVRSQATTPTITNNANYTYMSIEKVGN